MSQRIVDIDRAAGLAISLVVFGHLLIPGFSEVESYIFVRDIIYKFHMPFFMFLSGFIMAYTRKPVSSLPEYIGYLKVKAAKFLPPYVIFSTVFLIADNTLGKGSWGGVSQDLFDILLRPPKSPAGFLWYIYVLFIYYALMPILFPTKKISFYAILLAGLILHNLPVFTEVFSINLVFFYFIFLAIGWCACEYRDVYYRLLDRVGWIFVLVFVVLIIKDKDYFFSKSFFGTISIPAIHYIVIKCDCFIPSFLSHIGKNSFYIYLMNSLVIGFLSVIVFRVLGFQPNLAWLSVFFFAGLFGPIVIHRYIIRNTPILNRLII